MGGAQWGDDEDQIDIDLNDDMGGLDMDNGGENQIEDKAASPDSGIFVPPNHGPDSIQLALKKNPMSVGLHVAYGEFSKAMELL